MGSGEGEGGTVVVTFGFAVVGEIVVDEVVGVIVVVEVVVVMFGDTVELVVEACVVVVVFGATVELVVETDGVVVGICVVVELLELLGLVIGSTVIGLVGSRKKIKQYC